MTPDNLDTLSDAELSEAFAIEVAGWTKVRRTVRGAGAPEREPSPYGFPPGKNYECSVTPFATSADAVLPWLPKKGRGGFWTADGGYMGVRICLRDIHGIIEFDANAPTFARAACIALLRAARNAAKKTTNT